MLSDADRALVRLLSTASSYSQNWTYLNMIAILTYILASILLGFFLLYIGLFIFMLSEKYIYLFIKNIKAYFYQQSPEYRTMKSCYYFNSKTHAEYNLKCSVNPSTSCVQCRDWESLKVKK